MPGNAASAAALVTSQLANWKNYSEVPEICRPNQIVSFHSEWGLLHSSTTIPREPHHTLHPVLIHVVAGIALLARPHFLIFFPPYIPLYSTSKHGVPDHGRQRDDEPLLADDQGRPQDHVRDERHPAARACESVWLRREM